MLLKGAYCVGEHFVDPQRMLFHISFLSNLVSDSKSVELDQFVKNVAYMYG